ncbi:MAG: DEAD/SNF2-like helicase, partial [Edafosvirus sp.]
MDEKKLWKYIKKNAKPSYQADYDDNGKLINNITNNGLNEGEIAVRGGGEYTGFSIKAVEFIKPLLTDARVSRAVKFMSEGDLQSAIATLQIVHEVREQGLGLLYGVLKMWLEDNEIPVPNEYMKQAIPIKSQKMLDWINSAPYSPLLGQFEVVDVGYSHGHTIVPESWQAKVFKDADELHNKMDKLEWRQGKPKVSFCAIYAMHIKKVKTWNE